LVEEIIADRRMMSRVKRSDEASSGDPDWTFQKFGIGYDHAKDISYPWRQSVAGMQQRVGVLGRLPVRRRSEPDIPALIPN
jgi:hypothetical protein